MPSIVRPAATHEMLRIGNDVVYRITRD
jgi:hypothetical protein